MSENINFKGTKLSKSRGAFVEVPYFLSRYDPDPLRYYLTATAPETRDTEACSEGTKGSPWEDFVERKSNELVAAWGSPANCRIMLQMRPSAGRPERLVPRRVIHGERRTT